MRPLSKGNIMFADVPNAFGANAFEPTVPSANRTLYYKGLRLEKRPVRLPRAPKPPSEIIKNFLLTF